MTTWAIPSPEWPELYERGRPGWPEAAVEIAGLPRGATVLDLGAGTGKLTRLLTPRFTRVFAVEPADEMRRRLEELCPEAEALPGTAQEIPLANHFVDGVFAAQSFHWFDDDAAAAEIARVLRPGGTLVLMWNAPGGPWLPSTGRAESFLEQYVPGGLDYDPLDLGSPRRAAAEPIVLPNLQTLDRDGLIAYYASMGWLAELPDGERLPILAELRSLLTADEYRRSWETHVYLDFRT